MSILKIDNLSFSYEKDLILDGVDMEVKRGDFAALIGRNGSGKSTLLKLILGELVPNSGSISCSEIETSDIGYVPQLQIGTTREFPITVMELVSLSFYKDLRGFKRINSDIKDRIMDALCQVGMENYADTLYSKMSGGQRQRVLIAKALAKNTELLLLDEPTNGIDEASRNDLYELLHHLNVEHGKTILIITHDLRDIAKYLNVVYELSEKKIRRL